MKTTALHRLGASSAIPVLLALAGCNGDGPDAYGNFESTEVTVSAEATGPLVRLDVSEGDRVAAGVPVALVDTVQLALQLQEIDAQAGLTETRVEEAAANLRSLQAQLRVAQEDYARTQRLFESQAATSAELNRLEGQVGSLDAQVSAARVRVRLVQEERVTIAARRAQLRDRITRATVVNPTAGTVLATFAEPGEFVRAGGPLYTVAPLDPLVLRAYITGGQLARVTVGGAVSVNFDGPEGELATRPGRVTWIAPRAEFTPTPIQTRDERTDQVYAIKVEVANPDGVLKIGMPGEVVFAREEPGGSRP